LLIVYVAEKSLGKLISLKDIALVHMMKTYYVSRFVMETLSKSIIEHQ